MNNSDLKLLREHWSGLKDNLSEFSRAFYENLFHQHPYLKSLFSSDQRRQEAKFVATLEVSLKFGRQLLDKKEYFASLGARHDLYQVKPEMYIPFRDVLLQTMREFRPELYNERLDEAWKNLYDEIVSAMTE